MSKYLRLYQSMVPEDMFCTDDPRRPLIDGEMRAVSKAKTDDDAVAIIECWNAWPDTQHLSALDFVREYRARIKQPILC